MIDTRRIEGWVFDLDDTLILERNYVKSGFAALEDEVRKRFAVKGFAAAAWRHFESGARGNIFNLALQDLGIAAESGPHIEALVIAYRQHRPSIALEADAEALLGELKGKVPIAILSDGSLAAQRRKIDCLKLQSYASPIILTDEWGTEFWKPNPRGFEHIQEVLRLPGKSLVYIGDNPSKDFHAPLALGWQCVRIARPGGLYGTLACDESITTIASFKDLPGGAKQ